MRLIDADALKKRCGGWYVEEGPEEGFIGTLGSLVDGQPTVDATPVVRCYQCRHWYKGHCSEKQIATIKTDPQFYCANGEKRE